MIASSSDLLDPHQILFLFFGVIFFAVLLHILVMAAFAPTDADMKRSVITRGNIYFLLAGWVGLSAYFVRGMGSEFAVIGVELALAVVLSLLHPIFAFSLFTSFFILRPWEIYENDTVLLLPKLMIGLCLMSLILEWSRSRFLTFTWSKAASVLGLFLFWVYLSTYKAPDPKALQADFFDSVFKVLIIFILCQNILLSKWGYRVLAGVVAISTIGLGATGLLYSLAFSSTEAVETGRLVTIGMLGNSNDIAAVMILGFPFALRAFLLNSKKVFPLLCAIGALAVTLSSVWLARSRGAILALIMSFGLLLFLKSKRKWLIAGWALVAIILFPLLVNFLGRGSEDLEQSRDSRVNYWITGMKMAAENPLLGVGYDRYPKNYEAYAPNLLYEWGERTAHSAWVLVLAETGFPGLLLLASFFVMAVKAALRHRDDHPEILLALVGYLIAISFLSHSYLIFPYLIAGIALASDTWMPAQKKEAQ